MGQESVPVKNIILPGLDGILSLAAALSFCRIGHPFVESKFTPLSIFPRAALDCFWSAFRLVVRFGQLPMAFRMPQRLLEVLLMTANACSF